MCMYVDTCYIQKSVYSLWEKLFFLLILIAVSYDINNHQSDSLRKNRKLFAKWKLSSEKYLFNFTVEIHSERTYLVIYLQGLPKDTSYVEKFMTILTLVVVNKICSSDSHLSNHSVGVSQEE